MNQANGVLVYLILFVVLFVIVFAIMLVGFARARRRTGGDAPFVGTEQGKNTAPQNLQYREDTDPMDDDVGGNLSKVPGSDAQRTSTDQPQR